MLQASPALARASLSDEKIKEISEDLQWRLLLHYKKDWKPGDKSEIDGGDFFLSPEGRRDPLAELRATLEAFEGDRQYGPLKQPALCAFKGRVRYLRTKWGLQFPEIPCEKFNEFISRFNQPKTVSLVFSSAYTNNPASMFGHLFFKVNSAHSNDLLNTGVNFAAAVPPDENGVAFIYFGVFGGYEGRWSVQPYYEKLNEYIKAESRDLWEYEVNLTPEETVFLLEHLWELETTSRFDYYFFDDNCAYQMGRVIEAVHPEWDLSSHTIYAIPGEMVKNFFNDPQTVKRVVFRPALRKKLFQKYSILSGDQKNQFFDLVNGRTQASEMSDAIVLETGSSYMDYQRQLKKGKLSDDEKKIWDGILSQRASLGKVELPPLPEIPADTRPDMGHDAYAFIPSVGSESVLGEDGHVYYGLKLRSAYHDLMAKDLGFKKYSEIQFPWFEIRHRPNIKQTHLEELGALKIISLTPVSKVDFHASWKTTLGFFSPKDTGCLSCRHFVWEAGGGLAQDFSSEKHILYQFLTMRAEVEENIPQGHRILPTFEAGWISTMNDWWKIGAQASYSKDIGKTRLTDEYFRFQVSQSYFSSRNLDFRQKIEWVSPKLSEHPAYTELRLDLSYYFR